MKDDSNNKYILPKKYKLSHSTSYVFATPLRVELHGSVWEVEYF